MKKALKYQKYQYLESYIKKNIVQVLSVIPQNENNHDFTLIYKITIFNFNFDCFVLETLKVQDILIKKYWNT